MMANRTKTVRYTATLSEICIKELKELVKEEKIPSVNFAINEAVGDYLKQIKKSEYVAQLQDAGKDIDFLARTIQCAEDFKIVDGEVTGDW